MSYKITLNGSTAGYHYLVKDHLDNIRVAVNLDGVTNS